MRSITLSSIVRRTRQHHAIEHATIHLLTARNPSVAIAGLSDPWGFTLYGNVPEEDVRRAVGEALLRLQAGEGRLAIHPNCGTNLTTTLLLATAAALLGTLGKRSLLDKLTSTLILIGGALFAAQPLGLRLQQYTTLAEVSDCWVARIESVGQAGRSTYRVLFE
jgi:hypothetical protein